RSPAERWAAAGCGPSCRDDLLQFLRLGGVTDGFLQSDEAPQIQAGQALVQCLHARLALTNLHDRVDLVNLVLADEVADGSVENHHFQARDASLPRRPRQQRLTDDTLQHEGELRA